MCSIAGCYSVPQNEIRHILETMNSAMRHRGPDASGIFILDDIGLCHNRLSILDLSRAGSQPMRSKCGRFVICFNGEIYNHQDLRKKYLECFPFLGHSDTETLLQLVALWINRGQEIGSLLRLCNGMFAFALMDTETKRLYLARDRMGKKPLYLYCRLGQIMFSSEIKAFKSCGFPLTISQEGIFNFFSYGHTIGGKSIYKEVTELPAAHVMVIDGRNQNSECYWRIDSKPNFGGSYQEAKEQVHTILSDAVRVRLISDVPFGSFLSGGIDSSAIAFFMQKHHGSPINTFSVGFDYVKSGNDALKGHRYSELQDARFVSNMLGTTHHEIVVTVDDVKNNLQKAILQFDEPFADPAALPTYMVSFLAKQYVTVCHTGEGGDELFGGYRRYRAHAWANHHPFAAMCFSRINKMFSPILPRMRRMRKIAEAFSSRKDPDRYSIWLETIDRELYTNLTGIVPNINPKYKCIQVDERDAYPLFVDQATWLIDDYMVKADRASMIWSLETRVPFLDYRLIELANSLPIEWKLAKDGKAILKDALVGSLPQNILEKPKRGFTLPLDEWFRNELKEYFLEVVFDSSIRFEKYQIKRKVIEDAFDMHQTKKRDYSSFLWLVLSFSIWASRNSNLIVE